MKPVPLDDVTTKAHTTDPARSGNTEFTYIDLSSVDQATKSIRDLRVLQSQDAPSRARQVVAREDVLVATVRPNLNGVAKVSADLDGAIASTGFTVLRPDPMSLDSNYLFHWVKTPAFIADMINKSTGASYPAVSDRIIKESTIPLPPLHEQRMIAEILDKADELRTKRHQALAHLDTLTQSVFHEMFTGNSFAVQSLGSLATFFGGSSLPRGEGFVDQPNGHLLVKVSDMNREGNERSLVTAALWSERPGGKASTCPAGCIVIPKRGASISTNKKRLTVRPTVLDPNLMAIQPSAALDVAYAFAWFEHFDLTTITSGSSVPQLNKQDLEPLSIPLPPLQLQQTFATRVAAVERLKEAHRKHLAHLDALFASLQHRAFNGEL